MRNSKRILPVLVLLAILTACAEAPGPVQAWKSLDTTAVSVDTAMRATADLWRAGAISDAQRDQIVRIHDGYRIAAQAANSIIKAWAALSPKATDTPPEVKAALDDAAARGLAVVSLARRMGGKP